jgi:Ribbon-helix-helix protein, copG family
MNQINKHKQNNHNARGANGRTVAPLAKTLAVQILTISNVPSDILEAIDELAARQDRSRSSFVRRELQRTVAEYQAKEVFSKSR